MKKKKKKKGKKKKSGNTVEVFGTLVVVVKLVNSITIGLVIILIISVVSPKFYHNLSVFVSFHTPD